MTRMEMIDQEIKIHDSKIQRLKKRIDIEREAILDLKEEWVSLYKENAGVTHEES